MGSGENEIVPGRETVVRRHGARWSFHLPDQHRIELTEDRRHANLSTPDASTLFEVERIDESEPQEAIVVLGEPQAQVGASSEGGPPEALGYPLPEIQDEFDRLRARWREAGLDEQEFNAWARGSTHEGQLRRLRRKLREVGG
jgi:hypothetical protein